MPLPEVEEILKKYKNDEEKVEKLLKEKIFNEEKLKTVVPLSNEFPSLKVVKERNKQLLNDLETTKGRLRSKAIFCPTEVQWETICRSYQENQSLPVSTWKCHLPIFV